LAEAALRYLISFDEVTTVIPGMRREKNLIENVKSVDKGPLPSELMEKLKAHRWVRNFY
jgi:aryl-alcohol dehydrogenase-like predicted oxidoreductase